MNKRTTIILSLCALFLFYKYIAQLYPSLIGQELMMTYGYDGIMLAVMASSYYYSYTAMQIIAGVIIDRFSIKASMFLAIILISIMMFIFTHTQNFYLMCLSRMMMGVGASFATVIYMKCAALHTTPKTFGIISSLLATATMLGAACGGMPIGLLFQKIGWRNGLNDVAIFGLIMGVLVLIFLQSQNKHEQKSKMNDIITNIQNVINKKNNWLLLMYSGFTFSPVAILGGLWGTPFLMTKFNLATADASLFLSIMFIGHAVGSPFWAMLSAKLNNKKMLMLVANQISLMTILFIIYGHSSYQLSLFLFFIFGFSVGCFMLSFEICREINSLLVMGFAVAFINSGEGLVGSIAEPLIGYILDANKQGALYSLQNYQTALSILPCCFVLSSIILMLVMRNKTATDKTYAWA